MNLDHVPGERMQVDFAGKKLSYTDKESGTQKECPVLVCTLPFSDILMWRPWLMPRRETCIQSILQSKLVQDRERAKGDFGGCTQ
jgi:hypothetical protein